MPNTLLTEYQSACRAAHEQVQMLQDLYQHLSGNQNLPAIASVDVSERVRQLRAYQEILSRKLREQDLLPTRPDPEREGLLELMTELKAAITGGDRPATDERLAAEESELLQLTEQILQHQEDEAIRDARASTREAIASLSASGADAG
jgi:hypothetical protein